MAVRHGYTGMDITVVKGKFQYLSYGLHDDTLRFFIRSDGYRHFYQRDRIVDHIEVFRVSRREVADEVDNGSTGGADDRSFQVDGALIAKQRSG